MRSRLVAVLATAALAACTTPATTGSSRDFVFIKYDPALYAREGDVQKHADAECAAYGRTARFVSGGMEAPMGFRRDKFACIDPR